ncbi:MAG: hypothetical protein J5I52_11605 [Saprospiraceae bacterium]|nr:hypothetical protein [Saprospiraceae bacterium]
MESKKTTNILLLFIAIGIWVIALQTFLVSPVKVVDGYVEVSGSVDVENTVSVSIDEVLGRNGQKYYYNNK